MSEKIPPVVKIQMDMCPRCGHSHDLVQYERFTLGDPQFTHWALCEATGEPLLLDIRSHQVKEPTKFLIHFAESGRSLPGGPNPRFPNGTNIRLSAEDEDKPSCTVKLPYPAKSMGAWKVECSECGARAGCFAGGRADDPKSMQLLCKKT